MLAKFFQKTSNPDEKNEVQGSFNPKDLDPRVTVHYGVPATASIVAFDPVQSLLAVGTLDGRIKVIGGDNIEALLVSPKGIPFKNLEFLQNQGFLVSISNENEVQVWDLEHRRINSTIPWGSNITALSVIYGTNYMYLGDEYGMVSVLKYDAAEGKLEQLPYYVPTNVIAEAAEISPSDHGSVVGVLPQPHSQGKRVLIAYNNGLIVLWDVSEDEIVLLKGNKDLQLKGKTVVESSKSEGHEPSENATDNEQAEKEISSLCWASTNGSVLAVGYVDGDIMFWNIPTAASTKDRKATNSSNNVVKLQLSSDNRRLPVVILHWSADKSHNGCGGRLFVYGGDKVGSEEVLTVMDLDWSSGIKNLKCIGHVDLTLNGSFADMVLVPSSGAKGSSGTLPLVLTNPGQLHVYDDACLSLASQQDRKTSTSLLEYPTVIPTVEPSMTVGKFVLVHRDGEFSRDLSKTVSAAKVLLAHTLSTLSTASTRWPLTGGVPHHVADADDYLVERIYIAGYNDGSVRIWDATYPSLSLIYVLESEVAGVRTAGENGPVSALGFCPSTLTLAVGYACGLVYLYKLIKSSEETNLNFVTEAGKEVHALPPRSGPQCLAMFSLLNAAVSSLQFANFEARLAVGFESGRVAMLDIRTLSVLFVTDSVSDSNSPIISLAVKSFLVTSSLVDSPKDSDSNTLNDPKKGVMFYMTKDAHIVVCDSSSGHFLTSQPTQPKDSTAISMYIIEDGNLFSEISSEKTPPSSALNSEAKNEPAQVNTNDGDIPPVAQPENSTETTYFGQKIKDLFVLLCCEDALSLYSLKSVIQGDCEVIKKIDLSKPCCWTTIIKKNEEVFGLLVLFQTGDIEIRSFPKLEVVGETSLMSILRWNFKTNMEKTMCSSEKGQIALLNGFEFAFISLLACENDFRIPESLPDLHDKVLAAVADEATTSSTNQKKQEDISTGILGGLVRGLRASKAEHHVDSPEINHKTCAHLNTIFSSPPFLKPSMDTNTDRGVQELKIDDIHIDEPLVVKPISPKGKNEQKAKGVEKERLLEGGSKDVKPQARTIDEIKAKYKKAGSGAGDVAAVAAQAKEKLAERGEKLEMLSEKTQELQAGAQNFADLASELAKKMEKRKWWNI